ncbi:SGNH/GDSL hydrolase family protein [Streptomyces sp. VRA16 Mangrove soil]|uniref:SGNH/GDSL hydrolase family protein n=1 Tax=Streptomyces sp. VRA16 Mangrove soil TaxID=2817434 RepID=UPI001A9E7BAB|nr:SGNH/GDSL hydrolase family protein [Streptomyces sp. VRA16 Mangrove soil]MBO1332216.1 SGNH/GDSL hydrolase family protein [Streptomyces sp. VRA16 Mangrove soil]
MRHGRPPAPLLAVPLVGLLAATALPAPGTPSTAWTGTWATAPTGVPATDSTAYEDQTLRQIVHTSVAGRTLRVCFTNEFGTAPLTIGEARVALRAAGGPATAVDPASDRLLRFDGDTSTSLAPGTRRWSDPVALSTTAGGDLVISVHLPVRTPADTVHPSAFRHNYVAAGNVTGKPDITPTATFTSWHFLSGVAVDRRPGTAGAALVAFGDSITDGSSTQIDADHRWPDLLAERLRADGRWADTGVLNAGIGGNRLLRGPNPPTGSEAEAYATCFGESGLKRFDRDVVSRPGVRAAVVLLGVNDLGHPGTTAPADEEVSAAELIAGHEQLIRRGHDRGLRMLGATILPFGSDTLGFRTPEREAARRAVNEWIRTSGAYDGVVDFDAALRDPACPERLLSAYDSGDGLHPNDAGMAAMAAAFPLELLR